MEFLQERHLKLDLVARDMTEVITVLVDHLADREADCRPLRDHMLRTALEREAEVSTCLGEGVAVPHCLMPDGEPLRGVLGVSNGGIDLDAPDGKPVHFFCLLATPEDRRDQHLVVLADIAQRLGQDAARRAALLAAADPAEALRVLRG